MSRISKWFGGSKNSGPKSRRPRRLMGEGLEDRRLMVVGAFGDAAVVPGGQYTGVPELILSNGYAGSAVVLRDGRHILTAAHVVDTDMNGERDFVDSTLRFRIGEDTFEEVDVKWHQIQVHHNWTGKQDGNDIAIITLSKPLPTYISRYDIYASTDERGLPFTMVGWGDIGSAVGGVRDNVDELPHWGQNRFDVASTRLEYDLDEPEDTNLAREALAARGDSGGPAFINGRVAGIAATIKGVGFGAKGYHTRVSTFAQWIEERMDGSRELVVNMNSLPGGNDGRPDDVRIEHNAYGDRLLVSANGQLLLNLESAQIDKITFYGSNDSEKITVEGDLGVPVTVAGGGGWDTLNSEPGSSPAAPDFATTYTITSSAITWDAKDTITKIKYSQIEDIVLAADSNDGTFYVNSLPNFSVNVRTGKGNNFIYVGNVGGSLDNLTPFLPGDQFNRLTIVGGGDDTIVIDDAAANGRPTYTVDANGVTRSRMFIGNRPYYHDLSIKLTSVEDITVMGAKVGGNFLVQASPGTSLDLNGSDGSDNFTVGGSTQPLANISKLQLNGRGGQDTLVINDTAGVAIPFANTPIYDITNDKIVRVETLAFAGTFVTLGTDIGRRSIEQTTVRGGGRHAQFYVREVAAGTYLTIEGGSGSERIFVGSTARRLDGIRGTLTVQGGGGADLLLLDDAGAGYRGGTSDAGGAFNLYEISERQLFAAGVYVTTNDAFESIELNTTAGRDKVLVPSARPTTTVTVNAGKSNDEITVGGTAPIDWVTGSLVVNGGDGADKLVFDDRKSFDDRNIIVTDTTVNYEFGPQVRYATMESLDILGGKYADSVQVQVTNSGVATTLSMGEGIDTLDFSTRMTPVIVNLLAGQATGLSGISGIENVIGGRGNDTLLGTGGANLLEGRGGRDLIIGGLGVDTILGGDGEDLLLAGSSNALASKSARDAIMAEWGRTDLPYASRVANLLNGGGRNGSTLLNRQTYTADPSANTLRGNAGLDLFFGSLARDTHDRSLDEGEVFIDSEATQFSVQVNATAVTASYFYLDSKTFDHKTAFNIDLTTGTHTVNIGGYGFTFTVTADGRIEYAAALDGLLSGRGTSSLRINGAEVVIDTTAITSNYLILDYIHMHEEKTKPLTVRLMPGYHHVQLPVVMVFSVTESGKFEYDASQEGILLGKGTNQLQVRGAAVTIDARALWSPYMALDYLPVDSRQLINARLLPGLHHIQTYGGDVLLFSVAANGQVSYDASLEGVFTGSGTTTLGLPGLLVTIDPTLSTAGYFTVNYATSYARTPTSFALTPGSHFVVQAGFVHGFTVSKTGIVDYDPSLDKFLSGRGTRTLKLLV